MGLFSILSINSTPLLIYCFISSTNDCLSSDTRGKRVAWFFISLDSRACTVRHESPLKLIKAFQAASHQLL